MKQSNQKKSTPPPRPIKRPEPTIPEQIAELLAKAIARISGAQVLEGLHAIN